MSLLAANLTYISEQQSTTPCAWYSIVLFSTIFFNSVSETNLISPKRWLQYCVTQDVLQLLPCLMFCGLIPGQGSDNW